MSELIISVENISKAYRIGLKQERHNTLGSAIASWVKSPAKNFKQLKSLSNFDNHLDKDIFWALKNINFTLNKGEVLGIIGKNGAGKSTLLKILSRITEPTNGRIEIYGRIASLLEVGTGFNPELTGRENVYLNGTILGMTKKEIDAKFDEIIDFSGVEKFIDTPVKRYSSGMKVRLAFSVAAHLDPEILIIDEVLAVGDAEFQKKCLGKMKDVSKNQGRTVLFVSHNMAAITQLCSQCISLSNGQIDKSGNTDYVVKHYLSVNEIKEDFINLEDTKSTRPGNKKVYFQKVWIKKEKEAANNRLFSIGENIVICFQIKFVSPNSSSVKTSVELKTLDGLKIANMIDIDSNFQVQNNKEGTADYQVVINDIRLYPDIYSLSFYVGDMTSTEPYDYAEDCISFEIMDGGSLTTRPLPKNAGLLFLTPSWAQI